MPENLDLAKLNAKLKRLDDERRRTNDSDSPAAGEADYQYELYLRQHTADILAMGAECERLRGENEDGKKRIERLKDASNTLAGLGIKLRAANVKLARALIELPYFPGPSAALSEWSEDHAEALEIAKRITK